jgi:hypothetical protein
MTPMTGGFTPKFHYKLERLVLKATYFLITFPLPMCHKFKTQSVEQR